MQYWDLPFDLYSYWNLPSQYCTSANVLNWGEFAYLRQRTEPGGKKRMWTKSTS